MDQLWTLEKEIHCIGGFEYTCIFYTHKHMYLGKHSHSFHCGKLGHSAYTHQCREVSFSVQIIHLKNININEKSNEKIRILNASQDSKSGEDL